MYNQMMTKVDSLGISGIQSLNLGYPVQG